MLNKKQSIPQVCQWGMGFLDAPINKMPLKINRHIFKTSFYDRNIGVLFKSDFIFMRESLEKYLAQICELDVDNHEEIDQLKLLFIKLDHHIKRMR